LSSKSPDHESGLDARPTVVAVERRNLAVDPRPVDLARELHQLVLHIDNLLELGPMAHLIDIQHWRFVAQRTNVIGKYT